LEKNSDGEPRYYTADEYLSGDVRHKLQVAKLAAQNNPAFAVNVQALETVQPKDLEASEIAVRLGATWLNPDLIKQFADELVDAPYYVRDRVKVLYIPLTGVWNVTNKSYTGGNIKATVTYGTQRANFYHILEESLNLRDARIFDTKEDMQGNKIRVLNAAATQEAQMKQQQIEDAFKDWIWKDPTRRQMLVKEYNERFNSLRPREYDGSHILFHGMSPEITLRPHQKNAIAHILYGGNTLLAHVVGAGKTYEMVAAAMEKKRLGLCTKTLICVPNHLTEQLAGEALQLYPNDSMMTLLPSTSDGTVTQKYFHLPDYVCAPIQQGDVVGTVELKLAGETIGVVELISGQDVARNPLLFGVDKVKEFLTSLYLKVVLVLSLIAGLIYGLWLLCANWNRRKPTKKIHRRY
jgi:N12 class adenine-specific DNA methylase